MVASPPAEDSLNGADEDFWRRQEVRREKRMGQPCCTQSGMSWTMMDMPGNFAVIVHGEYDCLNCFHHHTGISAGNYYSTRLGEGALITGETEEPLRHLVRLILEHDTPEAIIILGTCPVEVIGATYTDTAKELQKETDVPIVALRTSGLALSSQRQMLDWLYVSLAKLPPGPPVDRTWQREMALLALQAAFATSAEPEAFTAVHERLSALRAPSVAVEGRRVNLVGIPSPDGRVPEPVLLLHRAGIEVNGCYPDGASIAEWRAIGHAQDTFVVDTGMFPKLVGRLERQGQRIHEVPLPLGVEATRAFYARIGEVMGKEAEIHALMDPVVAAMNRKVAAARRRFSKIRMGVALRMNNNYRPEAVAYDGLGEVRALAELGFDLTLFIQGAGEREVRRAYRKSLRAHGLDLPFHTFPSPSHVVDAMKTEKLDVCVVEDTVRGQALDAGIPMIETRGLQPFLTGVPSNLDRVLRLVADALKRAA